MENLSLSDDMIFNFSTLILSAERFCSKDFVYMDPDSYYALHIFKPINESRRNGMKACVYDYLNLTGSVLGEKILRSWMYKPSARLNVIRERHDTIACLMNEQNGRYFDDLTSLMKNFGNLQVLTKAMTSSTPPLSTWVSMDAVLRKSAEILQVLHSFSAFQKTSLGQRISEEIDVNVLKTLITYVSHIIDFESSKEWKRVYVKDGVNKSLDELRMRYNTLEEVLHEMANDLGCIFQQIPQGVLNVVYIPQLGYLISVDTNHVSQVPHEWVEVFQTATTGYYKEGSMEKMDDEYGDLYQLMTDYEIEILYSLQCKFTEESSCATLLRVGSLFAELDCFLSLARVALLHDFVKPDMSEDPIIFIEKGRHIIVEQHVSSFVPNDTTIPELTVSVITGANSSGKSVYLTHVGIIVFLAHCGSYIPAARATIGVTDKILTRIVTREAIDKCESTFFIDLQKMSKCVSMCTSKSFLLVDEFGKGTDAVGGPSLLGAIIESLAQSEQTPRTIITTHFHELFSHGVLRGVENVKHNHMDVIFTRDQGQSTDKITYLFNLMDGLTTNSFGIDCAETCGIPPHIIVRAREIANMPSRLMASEQLDAKELERAKFITREFLLWDLEQDGLTNESLRHKVETMIGTVQTGSASSI